MKVPVPNRLRTAVAERIAEALPLFARTYELDPVWRELVPRLVPAGLLPDDPVLSERIVDAGR